MHQAQRAFRRQAQGTDDLQPWDVGYWAEKQRQALYDFDEEALRAVAQQTEKSHISTMVMGIRSRVLEGLAYVADSSDLVPDDVPVLGLVDDAIMLELVLRELHHELEGYEEFDAYRGDEARAGRQHSVSREDWLESKREALFERMRERRERDLARTGPGFSLITHW